MPIPTLKPIVRLALVAGAAAWGAPPVHAADLLNTCAPEVASYCSDVSNGRGRITACLVGNSEKLGSACRGEVQNVASKTASSRLAPEEFRTLLRGDVTAPLPASCDAVASALCPDVARGDSRIFACLYAYNDRISATCSTDAKSALN